MEALIRQALMGIPDEDERELLGDRLRVYLQGQSPATTGDAVALIARAMIALRRRP
jgi:hypothetical protein